MPARGTTGSTVYVVCTHCELEGPESLREEKIKEKTHTHTLESAAVQLEVSFAQLSPVSREAIATGSGSGNNIPDNRTWIRMSGNIPDNRPDTRV